MTRPVILLDVDGVINAVHPDPERGSFDDFALMSRPAWVRFSPEMGRRLTTLRSNVADVVWLTTWEMGTHVRLLTGLLGWEDTPVLHPTTVDFTDDTWWKATVAERYITGLSERPPFAWIDDDLEPGTSYFDQVGWVCEHTHLLVCPTWNLGLLPVELDRVEEWLRAVG